MRKGSYLLVIAGAVTLVVTLAVFDAVASAQEEPAVARRTLDISFQSDEEQAALIIGGLDPTTLLTIRAIGFDGNVTGVVTQCVAGTRRNCDNRIPVRFDERGRAVFQYLVTDTFGLSVDDSEPCRLGSQRCTIEIRVGGTTTVVDTVFIDEAPTAGLLEVEPRRGLVLGQEVTVTASGFPAGAELIVSVCASPSLSGSRCGAPGPELLMVIGPEGVAESEMILDVAEVGTSGVACGRRTPCRVVVASDGVGVRARPVTLAFRGSPGATYGAGRVIVGLLATVGLLAAAGWLVRSTDWSPPPEADSSLIDEAEFADLDLEADRFDEAHPPGAPAERPSARSASS